MASFSIGPGLSPLSKLTEMCPTCDQVIPPDKIGAVKGRIAARDAGIEKRVADSASSRFAIERQTLQRQVSESNESYDAALKSAAEEFGQREEAYKRQAEAERGAALEVASGRFESERKALEEQLAAAGVNHARALTDATDEYGRREKELRDRAEIDRDAAVKQALRQQDEESLSKVADLNHKLQDLEAASAAYIHLLAEKDSEIAAVCRDAKDTADRIRNEVLAQEGAYKQAEIQKLVGEHEDLLIVERSKSADAKAENEKLRQEIAAKDKVFETEVEARIRKYLDDAAVMRGELSTALEGVPLISVPKVPVFCS